MAGVTFLTYYPAWFGTPLWDDPSHITRPDLRSLHGLARIWIEPGATQQYYPLVHTFFWIEHRVWGDYFPAYHLLNLFLHAFLALLLVQVLRRLKLPGAWFAGFLFALHPVEVESVAWISELKNTLSGLFYMAAAWFYLEFDVTRKGKPYSLALLCFLAGLMSKSVIATLPAGILVVFWWKRGRLGWRRDVLPFAPFFLTGAGAGMITGWVERRYIGAQGADFDFSFVERCLIAGRAFWFYLWKLVWPANLLFIYPRWEISQTAAWQYLFPLFALLLLAGVLFLAFRGIRWPLAAWLFFAFTLFPALGFVNVYPFLFSFVADHFQYLAGLGVIVPFAVCSTTLAARLPPWLSRLCAVVILLILAGLTWRQSRIYANVEILYRSVIAQNSSSWMAYNNLGLTLAHRGHFDEAIDDLQKAERLDPQNSRIHENLARTLEEIGGTEDAVIEYRKAIEIRPDYAQNYDALGKLLTSHGRLDEGIAEFRKALAVRPGCVPCIEYLAETLLQKGETSEALSNFRQALQLDQDNPGLHEEIAQALSQSGQIRDAIFQYREVLRLDPQRLSALNNLSWLLATSPAPFKNGSQAIECATRADQLSAGKNPAILDTLAAAYAAAGRFSEAVSTAKAGISLAGAQNQNGLADRMRKRLALYEAGSSAEEAEPYSP